jgi:hypothetical protein
MQIKKLINHVRHAVTSKLLVTTAAIVITGGVIAVGAFTQPHRAGADLPRDCIENSIIYCGATTIDEFVKKYKQNKSGDLKSIYAAFGLSENELSRFELTAKPATIYKNGQVKVDGKVWAHDAKSIGRWDKPGATSMKIAGKTYYLRDNSRAFESDSIKGFVMMNGDKVEFITLTSCGNPVKATQPSYSCDMLKSKKVNDTTYQFSANVTANNGAKLSKVVYDFGDGKKVTKTKASDVVTHEYAKPGTYNAKVTAYFDYFNNSFTHTSKDCATKITVPQPPKQSYACDSLSARKVSRTRYEFTAVAEMKGATLKNADFSFGDNQSAKNIEPKDAKTVVVEHEYAREGEYKITATLNFTTANGIKSDKCIVTITVDKQPPKECKPGIPEGDERCEEKPEQPQELPSTGPAEIIGSAIGLGSIAAASGYYLRTRRDLLGVIFKR